MPQHIFGKENISVQMLENAQIIKSISIGNTGGDDDEAIYQKIIDQLDVFFVQLDWRTNNRVNTQIINRFKNKVVFNKHLEKSFNLLLT